MAFLKGLPEFDCILLYTFVICCMDFSGIYKEVQYDQGSIAHPIIHGYNS